MKHMTKQVGLFLLAATAAHADVIEKDGAYLDQPYGNLRRIEVLEGRSIRPNAVRLPAKSDVNGAIAKHTPVKAQGARGTCSIFSATAMLEQALVANRGFEADKLDLAEEWLEYLIMRRQGSEGSSSDRNFRTFAAQGAVDEDLMPYIGETWETATDGLAQERCGRLAGFNLKACLLGHRDPALLDQTDAELEQNDKPLLAARTFAKEFLAKNMSRMDSDYYVSSDDDVKKLLAAGVPVTLDIDFYYGAWNHRTAPTLGIDRDEKAWARGEIGYPELGSMDRLKSPTKPAGHSVVLVGYDDEATMTTRVKMATGTFKTFTYKGVYYFKNSWGTGSFATEMEIQGQKHVGYGAITYKYANEYGGFFKLPLK